MKPDRCDHVPVVELEHGDLVISTDRTRVDVAAVHEYLSEESYWAAGRALQVQKHARRENAGCTAPGSSPPVRVQGR